MASPPAMDRPPILFVDSNWKPSPMDALPALELIALVSSGYENVDLAKGRCRP